MECARNDLHQTPGVKPDIGNIAALFINMKPCK
jgi:hypothetical protein